MSDKVRAVLFGIGVIGSAVAKTIVQEKKDWIELVGAIDIDPNKVGKDLAQVLGLQQQQLGVTVSDNVERVIAEARPDIVIHTTSSYLDRTFGELKRLAETKVDIVSSCEELSYPYVVDAQLAQELDAVAKRNGITMLGTGVNPGFLMDVLPLLLTTPCLRIEKISVSRQMNAANRRVPFQKKIGAGMSEEEFRTAVRSKSISGHVGLKQSIAMLADALGWKLDELLVEEPQPVVFSDKEVKSEWISVPPGRVTGLRQYAGGIINGRKIIDFEFVAYIGAAEEYDAVKITGVPTVSFRSNPCVNGDPATVAILINMLPKVIAARPGLVTMKDLPVPFAAHLPVASG